MLCSLTQGFGDVLRLVHRNPQAAKSAAYSRKVGVAPAEGLATSLKQDAMIMIDPARSLIVKNEDLDVQAVVNRSGKLTNGVRHTMVSTKSPDGRARSRACCPNSSRNAESKAGGSARSEDNLPWPPGLVKQHAP